MAKKITFFVLLISIVFSPVFSHATPPPGYSLVWSDEFNGTVGSAPNPANWNYDTGQSGWGNNELENYTTSTANAQIVSDPAATDGKSLAIIVIDTNPGSTNYNTVGRYTSARIKTENLQSFQYGWMEANIKAPTGQGMWPAYWMLGTNIGSVGWPNCGETDIMEQIGNPGYTNVNYGSLHDGQNWSQTYTLPSGQFYTTYHTFSVLWQPNQIQFYVDNTSYETVNASSQTSGSWGFNHPFFFIMNVAVGGNFPGSPPNSGTSFPQTMYVDYVRVYQANTPTVTPTFTPTATFTPPYTPTPCGYPGNTCTPTPTPTPTWTPTPVAQTLLWPNPSDGTQPIHIPVGGLTAPTDVNVKIYTTGFRKVHEEVIPQVQPSNDLRITLKDNWQAPLANGLYYVVVTAGGQRQVLKLLVFR